MSNNPDTGPPKEWIDGTFIETIIDDVQPALVGRPKLHILLACLTIAVGIMNPNLSSAVLQKAVEDTSEWLTTYSQTLDKPSN